MLTEKRSLIFDVYEQKLTRLIVDAFFHMKRIGRRRTSFFDFSTAKTSKPPE